MFCSKNKCDLFSAVYLIGAMALSMFSLVATVMVLAVHHQEESTPVPGWLKSFLRLQPKSPKVGVSTLQVKPVRNSSVNLLDVTDLNTEKEGGKIAENIQSGLLYNILLELRKLNKQESSLQNEWKIAAKKLDKVFFYAFLVTTLLLNIILLGLYANKG